MTTPESLFILLTAEKSRRMLAAAQTVIVDEIHAVADDKRGSHLALSLERLERLTEQERQERGSAAGNGTGKGHGGLQRIGLSATVKPITEVARFLSRRFAESSEGKRGRIIQIGRHREMDLAVEVPSDEFGPVASNKMWAEIYDRIAALIEAHRTTLVFVNTRRLAERVTHHLEERLGEGVVMAHHGSLSHPLRLEAERQLKSGQARAVVATASLELGSDVGTIEFCGGGFPFYCSHT